MWQASYYNEKGDVKHIKDIVQDQNQNVNFKRHFGSCILPCSECPISNIVDVSLVRKITKMNKNFERVKVGIKKLCKREQVVTLHPNENDCINEMQSRVQKLCNHVVNNFSATYNTTDECQNDTINGPSGGAGVALDNVYNCQLGSQSIQELGSCFMQMQ